MLRNFIRDRGVQVTLGTFVAIVLLRDSDARFGVARRARRLRSAPVDHGHARADARRPRRARLLHPSRRDVDPASRGHRRHRARPLERDRGRVRGRRRRAPRVARVGGRPCPSYLETDGAPSRRRRAAATCSSCATRRSSTSRPTRTRSSSCSTVPGTSSCRGFRSRGVAAHRPQPAIAAELDRAHVTGAHRTLRQDLAFAIDQLVEIAIRALSPAVNDTFTALTCIDWLSDGLCQITAGWHSRRVHFDDAGKVRLIAAEPSYERFVDRAFDKIRQAGRGMPAVMIRQLDALAKIMEYTTTPAQRDAPAPPGGHDPAFERGVRLRGDGSRRRTGALRSDDDRDPRSRDSSRCQQRTRATRLTAPARVRRRAECGTAGQWTSSKFTSDRCASRFETEPSRSS